MMPNKTHFTVTAMCIIAKTAVNHLLSLLCLHRVCENYDNSRAVEMDRAKRERNKMETSVKEGVRNLGETKREED